MLADLPVPAPDTICDQRYGWLSAEFDSEVRRVVINTIKTLLKRFHNQNPSPVAQQSNRNAVSDWAATYCIIKIGYIAYVVYVSVSLKGCRCGDGGTKLRGRHLCL